MIFLFTLLLVLYWFFIGSLMLLSLMIAVSFFINGMEDGPTQHVCFGAAFILVIITCFIYFGRNGYLVKAGRYLNEKATPVAVQPEKQ